MGGSMLAGRLEISPRRFAVREVPVPEPGPGQVRIRVRAAGVCLSDVHLIDGSLTPLYLAEPEVTLGHEVSGEIDALGPDVPEEWQPGQRVVLEAGERCRQCANCARLLPSCLAVRTRGVDYDGGWAEYALASAHTLIALPDDLPYEQAAIVPDAVSTPWGAITTTAAAQPGRPAGVWGAGGLGSHAVQLLRLIGAAPIVAVDPLPAVRDRVLDFGADLALDPAAEDLTERVFAATGGAGLDVAFDMAGIPAAREQAVTCLARDGKLVLVGLAPAPLTVTDSIAFSYLQKRVLGHYGSRPGDVDRLITLARHHRLDWSRSITATLPLTAAPDAVERLTTKQGNPIRLVLTP
jgi:threonine dehydrogenase-like Zn-dependent dehydrogenase